MAKNCYCDWNLVWWWFWIFGSGSDYVLSKIFRSELDSHTIKIFQSGSDYQISISAQHCQVPTNSYSTGITSITEKFWTYSCTSIFFCFSHPNQNPNPIHLPKDDSVITGIENALSSKDWNPSHGLTSDQRFKAMWNI